MSTLYVTQQDVVLRKTDERLKVTQKGSTLLDVPMLKVSQVGRIRAGHRDGRHLTGASGTPGTGVLPEPARALCWPD